MFTDYLFTFINTLDTCIQQCILRTGMLTFEMYHNLFHLYKNVQTFANHRTITVEPPLDKWTKLSVIIKKTNGYYETDSDYTVPDSVWKGSHLCLESYDKFALIEATTVQYNEIKTKTDTLWMHKISGTEHLIYSSWNTIKRNQNMVIDRALYNDCPVSKAISQILHVEYTHPYMKEPITFSVPKSYYIVSNELFTPCFVLSMLELQTDTFVYDERYTIIIMDSSMKTISLKSNEFIVLTESGYDKITVI